MKLSDETARTDSAFASPPVGEAPGARPANWLESIAEPRYAWPILLIVGVALYLVNLGGYPLYTKGEPREAVTIFDIVHAGGIILPQRAGVEIPSKPLLMHWLAAIVSLVAGGVNEFTVRLPSAGFAIAGVIVCYFYVRRLFDNVTALVSALILATTFQYLQAGTGCRVDMTLTFFLEIAFFEFIFMAEGLTPRWIVLYVAIALAILTKGPIGLVLPGLVALIFIVAERRWAMLREMKLVQGAIIVIVLAGSWYVAALIEGGADFFRKQILSENLFRFVGGSEFHEGHLHHFYYMELALVAGFMPWTILLPIVGVQAARAPRAFDSRLKYILIWTVAVLVFFNLPQSKRGVYLLSMYPALATLLAIYVRQTIAFPESARSWILGIARLFGLAMLLLGSAALVALAMMGAWPHALTELLQAADIRAPAFAGILTATVALHRIVALAMPLAVIVVGVRLLVRRASVERTVLTVAAAMVFITVAVNVIVVPAIADTLSLKNFTNQAMKIVDGKPVGYLEALNYDVAFYSGRTIPILWQHDAQMPEYVIAWRTLFDDLPDAKRGRFAIVMVSNPTSLDGSDEMVLLHRRDDGTKPSKSPDGYIEAGNF